MNGHGLFAYKGNPRSCSLPESSFFSKTNNRRMSLCEITVKALAIQPVVSRRERDCMPPTSWLSAGRWHLSREAQGHGPANQAAAPVVCVVCLSHRAEWIACTHSTLLLSAGENWPTFALVKFFHCVYIRIHKRQKAERMRRVHGTSGECSEFSRVGLCVRRQT